MISRWKRDVTTYLEFPDVWKPQTTLLCTLTAQPMHKVSGDGEHLCVPLPCAHALSWMCLQCAECTVHRLAMDAPAAPPWKCRSQEPPMHSKSVHILNMDFSRRRRRGLPFAGSGTSRYFGGLFWLREIFPACIFLRSKLNYR